MVPAPTPAHQMDATPEQSLLDGVAEPQSDDAPPTASEVVLPSGPAVGTFADAAETSHSASGPVAELELEPKPERGQAADEQPANDDAADRSPRDELPASTKESPTSEHDAASVESVVVAVVPGDDESAELHSKPVSVKADKPKKRHEKKSKNKSRKTHAVGLLSSVDLASSTGSTDVTSAEEDAEVNSLALAAESSTVTGEAMSTHLEGVLSDSDPSIDGEAKKDSSASENLSPRSPSLSKSSSGRSKRRRRKGASSVDISEDSAIATVSRKRSSTSKGKPKDTPTPGIRLEKNLHRRTDSETGTSLSLAAADAAQVARARTPRQDEIARLRSDLASEVAIRKALGHELQREVSQRKNLQKTIAAQAAKIAELQAEVSRLKGSAHVPDERSTCSVSESASDSPGRSGGARRVVPELSLHSAAGPPIQNVNLHMDALLKNASVHSEQATPVRHSPRMASSPRMTSSPRHGGTLSRQKGLVTFEPVSPRRTFLGSDETDVSSAADTTGGAQPTKFARPAKSADEAMLDDDISMLEIMHRTAPEFGSNSELSVDDGDLDDLLGDDFDPSLTTQLPPSSPVMESPRKAGGDVTLAAKSGSHDSVERTPKSKRKEKASFFNKFKGTVRGRRRPDALNVVGALEDEEPTNRMTVSAPVMTGSTLVPGQRDQLLMLLQMRQSRESLVQKKILPRRSVFGVPLDSLLEGEDNTVPSFLVRLLKFLQAEGAQDPELFEATSAAISESLDMRSMLCAGEQIQKPKVPGAAVQLLLQFLRELPEPLCTQALFREFIDVAEVSAPELRLSCLQSLVYRLPPPNRTLMQQLVSCLRQICTKSEAHSLSTAASTFASTIFRDSGSDPAPTLSSAKSAKGEPSAASSASATVVSSPASALSMSTGGESTTTSGPTSLSMSDTQSPRSWRKMTLSDEQQRQRKVILLEIMFRDHDHLFYGQRDVHFKKESGGYFVTACSFDRLVERIMDEHYQDPDFLSTVLLTHSYYTTATLLLNRIIEFFTRHLELSKATDCTDTIWIDTLLEHVIQVLATWTIEHHDTLKDVSGFKETMKSFICQFSVSPSWLPKTQKSFGLLKSVYIDGRTTNKIVANPIAKNSFYNTAFPGVEVRHKEMDLLDLYPYETARQIALIDHGLLTNIPIAELLHKRYMDPKLSPHFATMTNMCNRWSLWVATEVLKRDTPSARADVIEHLVELIQETLALKDFNATFCLLAGLVSPAVSRLKLSWERVHKRALKKYQGLVEILNADRNYKALREILSSAEPPLVPYIALLSKDLFGVEENTDDFGGNLINMSKMRLLAKIIHDFQHQQRSAYSIHIQPELRGFLKQSRLMTEDDQFATSLRLEPRRPSKK